MMLALGVDSRSRNLALWAVVFLAAHDLVTVASRFIGQPWVAFVAEALMASAAVYVAVRWLGSSHTLWLPNSLTALGPDLLILLVSAVGPAFSHNVVVVLAQLGLALLLVLAVALATRPQRFGSRMSAHPTSPTGTTC